jgi:hypothetical protein
MIILLPVVYDKGRRLFVVKRAACPVLIAPSLQVNELGNNLDDIGI